MFHEFAIVDRLEPEKLDAFLHEHPKGTMFHTTYMYAVFKQTKHYYPLFLAAIDKHGDILALLLAVRIQTLPDPLGGFSSRSIFYAEPICREDEQGVDALTALIALHDAKMRHRVLFTEVRPIWAPAMEKIALERCGYTYLGYLNFMIDLTPGEDKVWNAMIKSCRADIRRSKKRGMRIEEVNTPEGVDLLYHFTRLSYEHSNVPLADKSLFTAALKILVPRDMVKIFVAYYEDEPVAADIDLMYKQLVYGWYGGLVRQKGISPVESLTWHALEWGIHNGYTHFDTGGAGWPDIPYGVRDFKAKFGGELVNYGRYRKVYYPWKLKLAEGAYERSRKLKERYKQNADRLKERYKQNVERLRERYKRAKEKTTS
jgi:hypothetical protein